MFFRKLTASLLAAIVFMAPFCAILWREGNTAPFDPNDSWQHGFLFLPFCLLSVSCIAFFIGRLLLAKGYSAPLAFASHATTAAVAVALAVALPAAIVSTFIGMISVSAASLSIVILGSSVTFSAALASFVWWCVVVRKKISSQ